MSTFRTGVLASMLAIVSLVGAACVSDAQGNEGAGGADEQAAAPAAVEVMLSDFAIDPSAIEVPSGQPLTFSIMNHGQTPHTFAVVVDGHRGVGHRGAPSVIVRRIRTRVPVSVRSIVTSSLRARMRMMPRPRKLPRAARHRPVSPTTAITSGAW